MYLRMELVVLVWKFCLETYLFSVLPTVAPVQSEA